MYSLKYKVTTSTCDSEGRLKLYSALQMMQDCSEMWIDSEPKVKDYFLQQNMAQLLATRQVEIIRVPDYKEELTVTTSVYGMKPMFGFRNTFIYDAEGNNCLIGPDVGFYTAGHRLQPEGRTHDGYGIPITIGNDVWIGQHVTIMPGVHIGDGAIIGANSVVASDIPPYAVAVGNPCRVVRMRFDDEFIAYLLQLKWWDWDIEKIERNFKALSSGDLYLIKEIKD